MKKLTPRMKDVLEQLAISQDEALSATTIAYRIGYRAPSKHSGKRNLPANYVTSALTWLRLRRLVKDHPHYGFLITSEGLAELRKLGLAIADKR